MRGVMTEVPEFVLEHRRKTGADRWDEMWDGVLHMTPMPSREHQDFLSELDAWIRSHWARPYGNRVHREINLASVGGWPHDFRSPDLVLLTPDRFDIDHDTYFEGAPLIAVEIHSPGDEAYEKLEFYAELEVPEVWIIHRDNREAEVFLLDASGYRTMERNSGGWLVSPGSGIRMKTIDRGKLELQVGTDNSTREILPYDLP